MKTSFPKSAIRAVLLEGIHPAGAAMLREEGFQVESLPASPDEAKLAKLLAGAHLVGVRSKTDLPATMLDRGEKLLAVGCFCIGTNQVDLPHAARRGVPVFNSPFSNTRSVAELTIAEVIGLHRRLVEKSDLLHRGVWDKSAAGAHEVRGRTIGIVGYGHIGSQVSVLAEALGMRVIFHDIVAKMPLGNARAVKSLHDLLKDADVVTLHVPATPQTKGLIGAGQLKRMKPGAMLINNARGNVVDVDALAEALREGRLGGAALDVFPIEPAGKGEGFESPLRGLGNVILTPHVGGSTEEAQASIAEDVAAKFIKFVNVGTTTGAVNVPEVELPEQQAADASRSGGRTRPHRILHFHRNVPGVLSKMHAMISDLGVNVSAEYLRTKDDVGYVVLDVDPTDGAKVLERLRSVPETIRVRMLW
ncbi:MAG: D-3-phosphoglycerate dehydrogenase [Phycisphaerae bacterium]|nr:MAG: D-3-phosphoglycerate dehydrogenase [Phycisphaerae bacterium]